ncbi:MAG: hypothetical protein ACM3MK_12340 [Chitinophagales bacterium]
MNKGDLFTVYFEGVKMTVCVMGSYQEEYSGEEVVVLAVITPDNILHIPINDFSIFFQNRKTLN